MFQRTSEFKIILHSLTLVNMPMGETWGHVSDDAVGDIGISQAIQRSEIWHQPEESEAMIPIFDSWGNYY